MRAWSVTAAAMAAELIGRQHVVLCDHPVFNGSIFWLQRIVNPFLNFCDIVRMSKKSYTYRGIMGRVKVELRRLIATKMRDVNMFAVCCREAVVNRSSVLYQPTFITVRDFQLDCDADCRI